MRILSMLLLSAWVLFAIKAEAQEPLPTPVGKGFTLRQQILEAAKYQQMYNMACKQRLERIETLISTLKQSTGDTVATSNPKTFAIQVLGEERASEAVDVLIDNLLYEPKEIRIIGLQPEWAFFPAAVALIKIGQPAMEPLIRRSILGSGVPKERRIAARILSEIEGREQAAYRLQRLAKTEIGLRKTHLSDAAVYIKNIQF